MLLIFLMLPEDINLDLWLAFIICIRFLLESALYLSVLQSNIEKESKWLFSFLNIKYFFLQLALFACVFSKSFHTDIYRSGCERNLNIFLRIRQNFRDCIGVHVYGLSEDRAWLWFISQDSEAQYRPQSRTQSHSHHQEGLWRCLWYPVIQELTKGWINNNDSWCLLGDRSKLTATKGSAFAGLLNSHSHSLKWVLCVPIFSGWGNWSTAQHGNLARFMQLKSGGPRKGSQRKGKTWGEDSIWGGTETCCFHMPDTWTGL